jgi:iron complex transport system permease protein
VPPAVLLPGLGALLAAAALLSVGLGALRIAPDQVIAIVAAHAGIDLGVPYGLDQDAVLWSIRLPRVVLGVLVGGGLAVAGAALQGVFRNPLADPSLIGVSSGASLGAVAAIVLGVAAAGSHTLPLLAFAGGVVATLAVYAVARFDGRTEVVTLLLTGLAVNALCGAAVGYLLFIADDQQLRGVVFWSLGSLGGATWPLVLAALPFVALAALVLPLLARSLNLLLLGEREARHLGVEVERVRLLVIVLAALATGAAVAVAGIVGFVGLIVPHLVRLVAGPDHRVLLPASGLLGAALLLFADLFARTVAAPAELPLGVVTALLGAPFFLWLLRRTRREHGGWG